MRKGQRNQSEENDWNKTIKIGSHGLDSVQSKELLQEFGIKNPESVEENSEYEAVKKKWNEVEVKRMSLDRESGDLV